MIAVSLLPVRMIFFDNISAYITISCSVCCSWSSKNLNLIITLSLGTCRRLLLVPKLHIQAVCSHVNILNHITTFFNPFIIYSIKLWFLVSVCLKVFISVHQTSDLSYINRTEDTANTGMFVSLRIFVIANKLHQMYDKS